MAQQPGSQPPPMSFVLYADSLKAQIATATAAAAAAEKERSEALAEHNNELQQRLWEQQQQLKQQQQRIDQLQDELASRPSHPAIIEEDDKVSKPKPSHCHPYLGSGVTSASRSKRPVSPWRRPSKAKK